MCRKQALIFQIYKNTRLVKSSTEPILLKDVHGVYVTGAKAAKMFNKKFCKNYSTVMTRAEIDDCFNKASSHADGMYFKYTMFDIIHALDNCANTAAGPNGVYFATVKQIFHLIKY